MLFLTGYRMPIQERVRFVIIDNHLSCPETKVDWLLIHSLEAPRLFLISWPGCYRIRRAKTTQLVCELNLYTLTSMHGVMVFVIVCRQQLMSQAIARTP